MALLAKVLGQHQLRDRLKSSLSLSYHKPPARLLMLRTLAKTKSSCYVSVLIF